jgi:outer membrane receptor protein involved in Fe transport
VPHCSGVICNNSAANLNLKPEESFGFDIGTDMRLHHDTALSFDLYHTNLYGQFFTSTTSSSYSGVGCASAPCTLYTSKYDNLAQSRYEGINLSIHHDPLVKGPYWQASVGFIRAFIVSLPAGFYNDASCPNTPCANVYLLPGENFNGATFSGVSPTPYANGSATIGYRWSPRKFIDLAPTYYGNGNAYFEPAFMEFDAHASYPLGQHVTLFATFRNITNIYGQSFATEGIPSLGAPTVPGNLPVGMFGIPYGPRALVVTANFKE